MIVIKKMRLNGIDLRVLYKDISYSPEIQFHVVKLTSEDIRVSAEELQKIEFLVQDTETGSVRVMNFDSLDKHAIGSFYTVFFAVTDDELKLHNLINCADLKEKPQDIHIFSDKCMFFNEAGKFFSLVDCIQLVKFTDNGCKFSDSGIEYMSDNVDKLHRFVSELKERC